MEFRDIGMTEEVGYTEGYCHWAYSARTFIVNTPAMPIPFSLQGILTKLVACANEIETLRARAASHPRISSFCQEVELNGGRPIGGFGQSGVIQLGCFLRKQLGHLLLIHSFLGSLKPRVIRRVPEEHAFLKSWQEEMRRFPFGRSSQGHRQNHVQLQ